jgi:hypothetical protein
MQPIRAGARRRPFLGALALAGAVSLAAATAGAGDIWVGAGAGYVKPEGVDATVALAGEVRLELGRHFALQPDVGYWKKTKSVSGVSASASDLSFGATALMLVRARPARFFAGAGPSIHHISGDVGYYGFSLAQNSQTRVGLAVLGGVDLEISSSLAFFATARYDWVSLETGPTDSLDQPRFYGGLRLRL